MITEDPIDPPRPSKPWPATPGPDTIRFMELVELFKAPALFADRPGASCIACSIFMALKVMDKKTTQEHFCATDAQCKAWARAKMKDRAGKA